MELAQTIKNEVQSSPKSGRWSSEEDDQLRRIVPFYGEKQWRKISLHMKGRTAIQCLHRWTKILKPGLVKGPWTEDEDRKLRDWVGREGPGKWSQCSSFIVGRSGKQCRERWFNNLNPVVKKGCWTEEEDDLIFKLYMQYGSSWSKIAKSLSGRTENSIKNRFYSTIRKIAADRKKVGVKEEEEEVKKKEEDSGLAQIQVNNTLYRLLQEKGELYESHLDVIGKKKDSCSSKKNEIFEDKSECDSEAQFEDLLSSIEKTLNKELMMKEINSCKDMTLDELQQKVFMFCNNNIMEFKYDEPDLQNDLSEINKKIHQEIFPYNAPSENNLTLNSAKILKENPLLNINMPPSPIIFNTISNAGQNNSAKAVQIKNEGKCNNSGGDDNKMFFLIQQLHSLEGMLSNTREELMKLESSIGSSEKNSSTAVFSSNNTNSHHNNNNNLGQVENNNNNNTFKYDDFDYLFDQKTHGNIFNDLILLENSILPKPMEINNACNVTGTKRNSPYEGEFMPEILKKQKIGNFDFDRNSANFLNNILEDNQ